MNELEYRLERAQYYQQCFGKNKIISRWEWGMLTGLWETAGWTSVSSGYTTLKWLEPDQREWKP